MEKSGKIYPLKKQKQSYKSESCCPIKNQPSQLVGSSRRKSGINRRSSFHTAPEYSEKKKSGFFLFFARNFKVSPLDFSQEEGPALDIPRASAHLSGLQKCEVPFGFEAAWQRSSVGNRSCKNGQKRSQRLSKKNYHVTLFFLPSKGGELQRWYVIRI